MVVAILDDGRPAIRQQDQYISSFTQLELHDADGIIIEEGKPIPNAANLQQGIALRIPTLREDLR
jgi:hypothetical protein